MANRFPHSFIWLVVVPDLRWRARRFLITAVGGGLIFAITLLLSGFSAGFDLTARRLVDEVGAEAYLVPDGVEGPFTTYTPFPPPAIEGGTSLLSIPAPLVNGDRADDVLVIGHEADGFGAPRIVDGRAVGAADEIVVDRSLEAAGLGDTVSVGGQSFTVVGETEHQVTPGGLATAFVPIEQANALFTSGFELATSIALPGIIEAPEGFVVVTRTDAEADLLRQMGEARSSIRTFTVTLWVLAGIIIGAVLYLAALERVRDFAVLKATGAKNRDLILGLSIQAVIVSVVASLLAMVFAKLMVPIYPGIITMPVRVLAPLPLVAIVIGLLGSVAGVRRATSADPAQAFGGP
ncbi:MAG: ABC transporter permease [Acidimicrobiia bacterium]|nr:ABC transporter permease [Acidimicrobiia bacterium]